jgi:poly(hydroxyalkanoate) depolymerase family esterase
MTAGQAGEGIIHMKISRTSPRRWSGFRGIAGFSQNASETSRLTPLSAFGANPGNLAAKLFIPDALAPGAPLVVVLHGCTQNASGYDHGTGWSELAERHGFAVLFPEQQRANNANLCFNWFEPGDMRRGSGEPASIRQMIDHVVSHHHVDTSRIFVTGLSAGGAMAGVMLATYPEMFAGGGLIAGLPFGVARSIPTAMQRMRSASPDTGAVLGTMVRNASNHEGPWPRISIWHGTADTTVNVTNADATVAQWLAVHNLSRGECVADVIDGYPHRSWQDADGIVAVEEYKITGMGHGTPINPDAVDGCGRSGPFLLDVGISSTQHLARIWGLAEQNGSRDHRHRNTTISTTVAPVLVPMPGTPLTTGSNVQQIIENALKSAGLMR